MGRPRLYATEAERQAEHRHRQARRRDDAAAAHRATWDRIRALHAAVQAGAPELAGSSPLDTLTRLTDHFAGASSNATPAAPGPARS